jgi:hypothetical protein
MKSLASVEVMSEIRVRLKTIRVDDHARWGNMTAKQMVRHLRCAYEMALGDRTVNPVEGFAPVLIKWVSLHSGMRWPKNIQTPPDLKRAILERSKTEFDALVHTTIEKMETLARGSRCAPTHPMFGPMSEKDWMRWGYLHADHHLRQFGR